MWLSRVINGTYEVLAEEQARLSGSDLRLFPSGFLFDSEALPENFDTNFYDDFGSLEPFLKEHLENFVLIDERKVAGLHFNLYMRYFTDGLPEEILRRLVHVKMLDIRGKVGDVDQLVKVLDILGRGLSFIKIESSALNQEIFDRLPKWCPVLDVLSIEEEDALDLAFVLGFQSLKVVHLHQHHHPLNKEIAKECFRKYENLVPFL